MQEVGPPAARPKPLVLFLLSNSSGVICLTQVNNLLILTARQIKEDFCLNGLLAGCQVPQGLASYPCEAAEFLEESQFVFPSLPLPPVPGSPPNCTRRDVPSLLLVPRHVSAAGSRALGRLWVRGRGLTGWQLCLPPPRRQQLGLLQTCARTAVPCHEPVPSYITVPTHVCSPQISLATSPTTSGAFCRCMVSSTGGAESSDSWARAAGSAASPLAAEVRWRKQPRMLPR